MSSSSKVIIVTGGSRGIGLAITKWLIKNSHKVVIVSRSEPALKAIKDEFPSQVAYLAADLTDFEVRSQHLFPTAQLNCPPRRMLMEATLSELTPPGLELSKIY